MKKLIAIFALACVIFSCKKESGPGHPKVTLLSEIRKDSLKYLEFSYNSDNQLTKISAFNPDAADNSLTSYFSLQYNEKGHIKQLTTSSMPDHVALVKIVLTYDSADRIATTSMYDLQSISPNTVQTIGTYTYNAKNQVIKVVRKDKNGNFDRQLNFLYYEDGHLKETQSLKKSGDQLWISSKSSFSLPDGNLNKAFDQINILLGNDFIAGVYSTNISRFEYSQAGVITYQVNEQMSNREFNTDGTLNKQKQTTEYVKPSKDDRIVALSYKYIQQ